ncbi:NEL-type E3 ubiquitin ligase domain-containing protein [Pseudomonas sp. GD03858]|uniref:dermonecrotic toxin domain-containing protein n=1 Tax=unclassified Pseudomonas TaxID=196821 RepID=UPI0024475DD9|nr:MULTISPECIES: DUF6543 domain-containing protein [unclassified Pseudomonas]MDH0647889.1 NEL-type E3 ubiquitin ligase domain-containing protein [Pseudomonas sp. GD03867]MDH0662737.1 NEL-type E3 ubiquitin ligase domain-containing protein [Pseudomonas sp. GD03858]
MLDDTPPYHQQQILRSLPGWTKHLHPTQAGRVLRPAQHEHINAHGQPADWFAQAPATRQAELRAAIARRSASRKALAKGLEDLRGISEFCEPLLQARLGTALSLTQAQFRLQPFTSSLVHHFPDPDASHGVPNPPVWTYQPAGPATLTSLLEAALHNFEDMTVVGPLSTLQMSATDSTKFPGLSTAQFVTHCRALDLGQRYQEHLQGIYDGSRRARIQALWTQARRDELKVQIEVAQLRGKLSAHGHQTLLQFCGNDAAPNYDTHPVLARTLRMFDIQLHDLLLLTPKGSSIPPYLAYLPFDHEHPVQEFTSLLALGKYLRKRLLEPSYRHRFLEHVALEDRVRMAKKLQAHLFESTHTGPTPLETPTPAFGETQPGTHPWQGQLPPSAPEPSEAPHAARFPALAVHEVNIAFPVWPKLFNAHAQRLKEDARRIAVPTADLDAKAQKKRLAHWGEQGLTLLNVAAMFVPGLDVVMLAVGAVQIMSSIFHGFEAWSEGNNAEAVDQVESLLVNLGGMLVIGGAAKLIKASGFVDWMESIEVENEPRLWHAELENYRSTVKVTSDVRPDEQGLLHVNDRHFVELDGNLHEIRQDPQNAWRLVHPDDAKAYQPRLEGNGKGAWRLEHERPQGWSRVKLLRRLGGICKGLDDAQILAAFDCTGLDRGVLEQLHANGEPPPALLEDALLRLKLDDTATDIIARTRDGRPLAAYKQFAATVLGELPGWPEDVVLEVFEAGEVTGSAKRYGRNRPGDRVIQLTRSDLDSGNLARIVLDHLNEDDIAELLPGKVEPAQRQQALQDLMAKQLESKRASLLDSLYDNQPKPTSANAQTISQQFPSLPAQVVAELANGAGNTERTALQAGRVPLRIAEEARRLQARTRLDRALLGLYRNSLANADSRLIGDQLLARHPQWTAQQCYDAALADRPGTARMIGQQPARTGFRSPLRLSDGRRGYPLSPGIFASRAEHELHALYPGMTDRELRQLLATLRTRGDATGQIEALRVQHHRLREQLTEWADAGRREWGAAAANDYNRTAVALNRAWQRLDGPRLSLSNVALDTLPSLTSRFDHITELELDTVNLPRLPNGFLQSFPNLRGLVVRASPQLGTTALIGALRDAPNLEELGLIGCNLERLPDALASVRPRLRNLRRLSLRHNNLTLDAADLHMLADLHLETLDLHANQIALSTETAGLFRPMRELRRLHLGDNPLGNAPDLTGLDNLATLRLNNTQLHDWPTGLDSLMQRNPCALRSIDLSDNQIEQIPTLEQVTGSHYAQRLRWQPLHRWRFDRNPLNELTQRRLERVGGSVEPLPEPAPEAEVQQVSWLDGANETQRDTWNALFDQDEHADLRQVVELVGMSRAARQNPTSFARQIWELLDRAAADSQLRERLDQVAGEFPVTCGDAGADGFSTLQIEVMAYDESASSAETTAPLFNFFRRLFRRDQVNERAQALYNARNARRTTLQERDLWWSLPLAERGAEPTLAPLYEGDDISDDVLRNGLGQGLDLIEVRLALRTNLADMLDYPEPQLDMLYRDTADISFRTEEAIGEQVEVEDDKPLPRRQWISRHPTWRRLLRAEFPSRFSALRPRWDAGVDYLEYCHMDAQAPDSLEPEVAQALERTLGKSPFDAQGHLRRLAITEQLYVDGMNRMAIGLENDEDALYLSLTTRRDPNN